MTAVQTKLRSAYLAGPMRGIEDFNFPAFRRAAELLRHAGWEIYSPAERDEQDPAIPDNAELRAMAHDWSGTTGLDYFMMFDLAAVCAKDAIICLPGWENSQGARLETVTAVEVGHPVFEYSLDSEGDVELRSIDAEYIQAAFAQRGVPQEAVETEDAALTDTGAMRVFETGATRNLDATKPDYEGFESPLVEWAFGAFMNSNRVQADGTIRASDNWQRGIPLDSYAASMKRHLHDVWLHHRGHSELAQEDLVVALCALRFNVNGYLHELVKGWLNDLAPDNKDFPESTWERLDAYREQH